MGGCCSADDIDIQYVNIVPAKSPSAVVEKNNISFDMLDTNITNDMFEKEQLGWIRNVKQCEFQNTFIENGVLQSDCICIQRISFILSKYDKYFVFNSNKYFSPYRFIHADFGKYYSQTNLLNDYIHILQYHSNSEIQETETKNDLFNITTDCLPNECNAVRRILNTNYLNTDSSDIQDIVSKHILDIIHLNLFHSNYIQSQLNSIKFETDGIFGVAQTTKVDTDCAHYVSNCVVHIQDTVDLHYYEIAPCFEYTDNISRCTGNHKQIIVQQKYSFLKQEIVENELFSLTINEWNFIAYKAEKYLNTAYKRSIYTNSRADFWTSFRLNNIICLLLISDFNELAVSLRSSYLKQSIQESDETISKRHANYWHLARALKETVQFFGSIRSRFERRTERMNDLWHCIILPKSTIIPWLRVKWSFPISTTKNLNILNNTKQGIIIALDQNDVCGFDCRWISKFQCEKEILLMDYKKHDSRKRYKPSNYCPQYALPIHCIIDNQDCSKDIEENRDYIGFIHCFIQIMSTFILNKYKHGGQRTAADVFKWFDAEIALPNDFEALEKYQKNMINLIKTKFKNVKTGSIYAKKVIDAYIKNKTELIVDSRLFTHPHERYGFLTNLFFIGENIDNMTFCKRINMKFLCDLFPNCNNLKIYNIKKLGDIDEGFMQWLFNELKQIKKIDKNENEKYELLINGYIRMYQNKWMIATDVIDLILLYYPKIHNKIEEITFVECIDDSAKQLIIKMQSFMPINWKIEVEKRKYFAIESIFDKSLFISFKNIYL